MLVAEPRKDPAQVPRRDDHALIDTEPAAAHGLPRRDLVHQGISRRHQDAGLVLQKVTDRIHTLVDDKAAVDVGTVEQQVLCGILPYAALCGKPRKIGSRLCRETLICADVERPSGHL